MYKSSYGKSKEEYLASIKTQIYSINLSFYYTSKEQISER